MDLDCKIITAKKGITMIQKIESLFAAFTRLTGNPVASTYSTQGEAREWLNAGHTEEDLKLMVNYRRATVNAKDTHILKAMLRWRFIIGDVQRFTEDLPEARAFFKKTHQTPRQQALKATGREVSAETKHRTVEQITKECDILRQFLQQNT